MNGPISMQPIASSQLDSIGHDADTTTMAIRFKAKGEKRGPLYHYANVTTEDFDALVGAESPGSHLRTHIKADPKKYPCVRIDEDDPT
jgi:hypothetical protein